MDFSVRRCAIWCMATSWPNVHIDKWQLIEGLLSDSSSNVRASATVLIPKFTIEGKVCTLRKWPSGCEQICLFQVAHVAQALDRIIRRLVHAVSCDNEPDRLVRELSILVLTSFGPSAQLAFPTLCEAYRKDAIRCLKCLAGLMLAYLNWSGMSDRLPGVRLRQLTKGELRKSEWQ